MQMGICTKFTLFFLVPTIQAWQVDSIGANWSYLLLILLLLRQFSFSLQVVGLKQVAPFLFLCGGAHHQRRSQDLHKLQRLSSRILVCVLEIEHVVDCNSQFHGRGSSNSRIHQVRISCSFDQCFISSLRADHFHSLVANWLQNLGGSTLVKSCFERCFRNYVMLQKERKCCRVIEATCKDNSLEFWLG